MTNTDPVDPVVAADPGDPVDPVLEAEDCRQKLPAWGVTRDFRFGQFIRLYDERIVGGRRQTTPIVLNVDGDIAEAQPNPNGGTGIVRSLVRNGATRDLGGLDGATPPPMSTAGALPVKSLGLHVIDADVDLDRVLTNNPDDAVSVSDIDGLLTSGQVAIGDEDFAVDLSAPAAARLRQGTGVMAIARDPAGNARVVRLDPKLTSVEMELTELDAWLSQRAIETSVGVVDLDEPGMRSILTTGQLVAGAKLDGEPQGLVRIQAIGGGPDGLGKPAGELLVIDDLAEFLTYPVIPSTTGGSVKVDLNPGLTRELRLGNEITTLVGGHEVRLIYPEFGTELPPGFQVLGRAHQIEPLDIRYTLNDLRRELYDYPYSPGSTVPGSQVGGGTAKEPADTGSIRLSRDGLPVAVLLPWQQTWTLKGFSRGNLLSTLALAPGEDTTITVASWERRSKALQQAAETDVEQTFDFTSTTRDTEDVFREVTSTNEFDAQAHGSLDASYSPGVASIRVQAGGQVANAQSLANACRTSTQHVRESTNRASTRVRSRRITTITESVETESRSQVVRHIRNANACHTLTMNFHEVLAHYDVDVRFKKQGVRIVVLVTNPVTIREFDSLTVRVNEATLRSYLLDPALADGFDACQLLESYRQAEIELRRLSGLSKEEKELDRERTVPPTTTPQKQANPQLAPLLAIVNDIKRRASSFAGADVGAALTAIGKNKTPTSAEVASAQRWLWRRLVSTKFGSGLITELDRVTSLTASPDVARTLLAAVPPAGSVPALDGLGGLGDQEKEDAGLAARIKSMPGYTFWDWGTFWYPICKRDGLYDVEDGGIAGALAQLRSTFQAWEAKESEGAGLQAAAAVVAQANLEQAATTLADRLEMKFGVETVGAAMERSEALRSHLNLHRDYYRYVLFQALPPSEQLQRLMDAAPQLRVGMFEPHVVASDGPNLAIPLSPLAETTLMKVVTNLAEELEKAAKDAGAAGENIATDQVILPTPGVSVESWLGDCSGCEDHLETLRDAEGREAKARARIAELEGDRRAAMIESDDLSDPDPDAVPRLHLTVESVGSDDSAPTA